jgi:hypothetical protein
MGGFTARIVCSPSHGSLSHTILGEVRLEAILLRARRYSSVHFTAHASAREG